MNEFFVYLKNYGCVINNESIYTSALTHASARGKQDADGIARTINDGKAIASIGSNLLNAINRTRLLKNNPKISIGDLNRLNTDFCGMANLAMIAKSEALDRWIITGTSLQPDQKNEQMFADALCGIVGALFLDSGFENANKYMEHLIKGYAGIVAKLIDYKSELQEVVQGYINNAGNTIQYRTVPSKTRNGPAFSTTLVILGTDICTGTGSNKKKSEVEAAKNALTSSRNKLISVLQKEAGRNFKGKTIIKF